MRLPFLSKSEKTPTSKVVSKNKLVSVGVQSPTEIKRSASLELIGNCSEFPVKHNAN